MAAEFAGKRALADFLSDLSWKKGEALVEAALKIYIPNAARARSTLLNGQVYRARVPAACELALRQHLVCMQTLRNTLAIGCATTRSKVSNGTQLLRGVDGRSSSARRFRDLVRAYEGEFDGSLTEVERGQIKQAVHSTQNTITFIAEQ